MVSINFDERYEMVLSNDSTVVKFNLIDRKLNKILSFDESIEFLTKYVQNRHTLSEISDSFQSTIVDLTVRNHELQKKVIELENIRYTKLVKIYDKIADIEKQNIDFLKKMNQNLM